MREATAKYHEDSKTLNEEQRGKYFDVLDNQGVGFIVDVILPSDLSEKMQMK